MTDLLVGTLYAVIGLLAILGVLVIWSAIRFSRWHRKSGGGIR